MNRARLLKSIFVLLSGFVLSLHPTSGYSCAVCYGDPASPMVQGAKAGVLFLAVFVYVVLMLMGSVVGYWMYRAHKLRLQEQAEATSKVPISSQPIPTV